jgi:hypothetical protein
MVSKYPGQFSEHSLNSYLFLSSSTSKQVQMADNPKSEVNGDIEAIPKTSTQTTGDPLLEVQSKPIFELPESDPPSIIMVVYPRTIKELVSWLLGSRQMTKLSKRQLS